MIKKLLEELRKIKNNKYKGEYLEEDRDNVDPVMGAYNIKEIKSFLFEKSFTDVEKALAIVREITKLRGLKDVHIEYEKDIVDILKFNPKNKEITLEKDLEYKYKIKNGRYK